LQGGVKENYGGGKEVARQRLSILREVGAGPSTLPRENIMRKVLGKIGARGNYGSLSSMENREDEGRETSQIEQR